MIDNLKLINFLQDFDCATLEQLQVLFKEKNNNFKSLLEGNLISKKGNIFVHNTKKINEKMIVALNILCKYKGKLDKFYRGYDPVFVTFLTKENVLYHIIIADHENAKGVVKLLNSYPLSIPSADKLILAFPNREDIENITCNIPFLYCIYPGLEIIEN